MKTFFEDKNITLEKIFKRCIKVLVCFMQLRQNAYGILIPRTLCEVVFAYTHGETTSWTFRALINVHKSRITVLKRVATITAMNKQH